MGLLSCGGPIFLLLPHRRNDIIWKINFKPQSWSLCAPFFIKSKLYFSTTLYCLILRCRAPFGHHRTKFLYALLIGRAPQVRHHGHHFAELRPQSEQHAKKKSLETIEAQGICGGSGGIRTHVPLRTTWFRVISRLWLLVEIKRRWKYTTEAQKLRYTADFGFRFSLLFEPTGFSEFFPFLPPIMTGG